MGVTQVNVFKPVGKADSSAKITAMEVSSGACHCGDYGCAAVAAIVGVRESGLCHSYSKQSQYSRDANVASLNSHQWTAP